MAQIVGLDNYLVSPNGERQGSNTNLKVPGLSARFIPHGREVLNYFILLSMCKECTWFLDQKPLEEPILNFRCECGNAVWKKSAAQPAPSQFLIFRCTKCDTLTQKSLPKH